MKNKESNKWILQVQEVEGTYTFSGKAYSTKRISEELSENEIQEIISTIRKEVTKHNGIDYLQVFKNDSGNKIYVIDNLNQEMKDKADPEYLLDNNYFTVMFAEEY